MDLLPNIPKQFVAERNAYRILLENGESCIFKPARDEEPANDRDAYVPQDELAVYNKFKSLQGRYIPICYGLVTLRGKVGLLMEDCGSKTFENPPLDENTKFILFLRATCAMERCLAAGLVHQDAGFRNIVYNPVTLQVRTIDIEIPEYERYKPQDEWISMDASFSRFFNYRIKTSGFRWGLFSIANILMRNLWDVFLYLFVLQYCFCLVKKKNKRTTNT